jgi:methyl-accepting chemotaxis protein
MTDTSNIYSGTKESISGSNQKSSEAEKAVEDTLKRIDEAVSMAKGRLDDLTAQTESLAKDISSIVVSMQFQDITRQRIEHVVEPLLSSKSEMEEVMQNTQSMCERIHEWKGNGGAAQLEKIYTMETEREVLRKSLVNSH